MNLDYGEDQTSKIVNYYLVSEFLARDSLYHSPHESATRHVCTSLNCDFEALLSLLQQKNRD